MFTHFKKEMASQDTWYCNAPSEKFFFLSFRKPNDIKEHDSPKCCFGQHLRTEGQEEAIYKISEKETSNAHDNIKGM